MPKKDEKLNVEFLTAEEADNPLENDVLITQLMIIVAKIGIRDLKQDNCGIIVEEESDVESS